MIHYHGTPITPVATFMDLAGRHFCVSHARPDDVERAHAIGQSVMLDNGAFSKWRSGRATDWPAYYEFAERWLAFPTTWAVIPDVIEAPEADQDALLSEWPFGLKGSPVWHIDESFDRLRRLVDDWPRVCFGSTPRYGAVMSQQWRERIDRAWDVIAAARRFTPWVHMLRGMQCSGERWPFASVDSTDIGQNHRRPQNDARRMADRWDARQCPGVWRR